MNTSLIIFLVAGESGVYGITPRTIGLSCRQRIRVNEVLSKESMDKLLEAKTNRKSYVKVRDMQISFDPDAILRGKQYLMKLSCNPTTLSSDC